MQTFKRLFLFIVNVRVWWKLVENPNAEETEMGSCRFFETQSQQKVQKQIYRIPKKQLLIGVNFACVDIWQKIDTIYV